MKLSSPIVPSFALQLFLVDLVLAHTLQFVSIMIPTQAGLRNLFPRDTSDPGLTPSTFISVPTQTGLPNSPPGEGTTDSSDAAFPTVSCFIVCPEPSLSTSVPASSTKLATVLHGLPVLPSTIFSPPSSSTSLPASSSVSSPTASPSPTLGPPFSFSAPSITITLQPPVESSSATNDKNNTSASQPRTVIIGLIVGLALLGGLAAVLFLLHRRSLSKRHNLTTFSLDVEVALPPSPSQKGGLRVGYAHPAAATTQPGTSESDLARKVAELEAWMQEELAALGRGQNHSEVESATTTTTTTGHGRRTKLDILAAHRARENDRKPVDRLPSYRQFDSGSA